MKVFLSWSGERSRQVASLLDDWLQCVLQAADPWMSSKDIDRGALWFAEISDQLAGTGIGIVCLTKENKNKPWILFESGALAKGISSSRVCTFLIDLKPTDVENPLAQFNHTVPSKSGLWELVRTINLALKENSLKESILEKVFETYWIQFEKDFKDIIKNTPEVEVAETRSENDILIEVLSSIRNMDRRMRDVESHGIQSEEKKSNLKRLGASEAQILIYKYLETGMNPELIKEMMEQRGVPNTFVLRKIEEYNKNQ